MPKRQVSLSFPCFLFQKCKQTTRNHCIVGKVYSLILRTLSSVLNNTKNRLSKYCIHFCSEDFVILFGYLFGNTIQDNKKHLLNEFIISIDHFRRYLSYFWNMKFYVFHVISLYKLKSRLFRKHKFGPVGTKNYIQEISPNMFFFWVTR